MTSARIDFKQCYPRDILSPFKPDQNSAACESGNLLRDLLCGSFRVRYSGLTSNPYFDFFPFRAVAQIPIKRIRLLERGG